MTSSTVLPTRRDERFALLPGTGFVDLPEGRLGHGRTIMRLTHVSAAGVQCTIDGAPPTLARDESIAGATVRVGECRIGGVLVVKNMRETGTAEAPTHEVGALFVPDAGVPEELWMAVLVGVESRAVEGEGAA